MIRKVHEIMMKDYVSVDALWGIRRVHDIVDTMHVDCFPVLDEGKIVGVLSKSDLIKSHPNRIVLDAMSGKYKCIEANQSVWKARELIQDNNVDMLFVVQGNKTVGILTNKMIEVEISKHTDILTGLYKSDYIIYKSQKLIEQCGEIFIIFFDLNNFGSINKQFGHIAGDNILKEFSAILRQIKLDVSYLCRYGGDEFILLTNKCAQECETIAKTILNKVKHNQFYSGIKISVSAGIAGGRRNNLKEGNICTTVINLINIASLASTKAKEDRNNLVMGYSGVIDEIAI